MEQQAEIVHLPTDLYRLREADRLVVEWGRIQSADLSREERVVALVDWRLQMRQHLRRFEVK